MTLCSEIYQLRRAGNLKEAYAKAKQALQDPANQNRWIQEAFGWVLYDLLKCKLGDVSKAGKGASNLTEETLSKIDNWFKEYCQLDLVKRPSLLHSCMLRLACKAQKIKWRGFLDFVMWWDLQNLRPEDRQPRQLADRKTCISLELMVLYAIGRAINKLPMQDTRLIWGFNVLQDALSRYPEDPWINRSLAQIFHKQGDSQRALQHIKVTARVKRRDWWIWGELGELLEMIEPKPALMCYYHACTLQQQDRLLVNIHLRMALLLERLGRYSDAAYYARVAYETRQREGCSIPPEIHRIQRTDWYQQHCNAPRPSVPNTKLFAHLFLKGIREEDFECRYGVIDRHNPEKRITYILFSPEERLPIQHRRFKHLKNMQVGDIVEVCLYKEGKRYQVVAVQLAPLTEIEGFVQTIEGVFQQRVSQNFGFIRGVDGLSVFVPPPLAQGLKRGSRVRAVACLKPNPKRNENGWRALRVEQIE
ncbi:MAG: tetratricopeptide repeat protein [Armatimonadota bacterium]